jgi:hypothetical protein
MTTRQRNDRQTDGEGVAIYEARGHANGLDRRGYATTPDLQTTIVTPTDRVRWGPIWAGLFTALTTLVVLGLLGLAIGLSSYDAGDPLSNFGIGAGIWGAVSTLLAFLIGGWLAAHSSAAAGRGSGMLNGAMVWVVTIPLLLYLLSSGVGALMRTAGNVAATGIQAAATSAGAAVDNASPGAVEQAQDAAGDATAAAQATATALGNQVTPETVENATANASTGAWGTLIGLLLGLVAALIGGAIGARRPTAVEVLPSHT